jgi:aryl-alcohol dehydrogenase-like predicted oxidoreductase
MINEDKLGNKIALGTAQFGLNYGISNISGKVHESKVLEILNKAKNEQIDTIDTAVLYGDSEAVLGRSGVANFNVVTKLPPIPKQVTNIKTWVIENINSSLNKLNVDKVYGLMLHRSDDFLGEQGFNLYKILCKLREDRIVNKIGVSIYSPDELDSLESSGIKIDIIQAPFNILDRRIETSGWLGKLKTSGVEIHTRSVFLQGLLLLESNKRDQYFSKWKDCFDEFDKWIKKTNQTPLGACLNFVNSFNEIDKIVVGIETIDQLREIASSIDNSHKIPIPDHFQINDSMLIDPSNWKY